MLITILLLITLFLAYFNGANDNFKGVATLYGSGTVNYKTAITIATVSTFIGSICAIFLAHGLVANFSGKGLVPQDVAGASNFLAAVGFGAACTVLIATRFGYPISTTHSLVGGLLGAGLMAVGWDVNFTKLGGAFFIPLMLSPFIALALGATLYWLLTNARKKFKLTKESCICLSNQKQFIPVGAISNNDTTKQSNIQTNDSRLNIKVDYPITPIVTVADARDCVDVYTNKICGVYIQTLLDFAHKVSAAAVSFARGLNDTPKIAGLLTAVPTVNINTGMIAIAIGMAIGGLLNARRVAETMSNKITNINHGQGFSANLVTSFLVIIASKFGVPVSTTHVSVGAIFGIGIVNKEHNNKVISSIILSWLITLPIAMLFSALFYYIIT